MSNPPKKTLRPVVASPKIGQITQGTIFCCAKAARYKGVSVFGLTITARCDVAQEKYRILNYVPVVSVVDWLKVDGGDIIFESEVKELKGKIKSELKSGGLSATLLLSVPINEVLDVHFPSSDKKKSAARSRIETANRELSEIAVAHAAGQIMDWLVPNRPQKIKEVIVRLFKHDISGYYFLERIEPDSRPFGHVCLLREVATLPKEIVDDLRDGMSKDRWLARHRSSAGELLDYSLDDFAMPVAQLGSPTIEHLMQVYANLFTRIGVEDPDSSDVDEVCNRLTKPVTGDES